MTASEERKGNLLNARLGCNVRGRLDAVYVALLEGKDREAKKELAALSRFIVAGLPVEKIKRGDA